MPGAQTLDEDTQLFFTGANAITVSDVDSDPDAVKVDLSVDHGGIVIGSTTTGATVTGDGTNHVTVQGTQAAVNAALDNTEYAPDLDYDSTDTLTVKTDDLGHNGNGGALDATNTVGITVNPVDDAPVLTASGTLSYTENDGPKAIAPAITLADVDSPNMSSATVAITGNYAGAEDVLHFDNTAEITGVQSGDTLTLSGTATRAQYEAALQSVTYENTSDDPSTLDRTISFTANDGELDSNTVTRTVTVAAVNDAPVVTTTSGTTSYTEGDTTGVVVDGDLTVTDPDDANLESGEVKIDPTDYQAGDELVFSDQNGIHGTYSSGVLTLTTAAGASKDDWQTALRSIKFLGTSDDPSASKLVDFKVNDGDTDSALAGKVVAVTPVDDAPTVTTSGSSADFTEGDAGTIVDPNVTVDDVDDTHLETAKVQITGNYQSSTDQLVFTNQNGIAGATFDSATGTLTLNGHATKADWQTALQSIYFVASGDNPSGLTRTVSFTVNDGDLDSNTATHDVTVTPVDDKPTVTTSFGDTHWTEGGGPKTVDDAVGVDDPDNSDLQGATITIATGGSPDDVLAPGSLPSGFTHSYNPGTQTLTITGSASLADYQVILEAVTFDNPTSAPGGTTRHIVFKVTDGTETADGGTKDVVVTEVNSPPSIAFSGDPQSTYTEDDSAAAIIDAHVAVSDPDSSNLAKATVEITAGEQSGDSLTFTDTADIHGDFASGELTLTPIGAASKPVAAFQDALRGVGFKTTNQNPGTSRTMTFTAVDDQSLDNTSPAVTRDVTVTPVNDGPVVTTSAAHTSYTERAAPVVVDSGATVTDVDSLQVHSATVTIKTGKKTGDALNFGSLPAGITGSVNSDGDTVTFTGDSSFTDYDTALQSVTFASSNHNPGATRTISFTADDGNPINGTGPEALQTIDITAVPEDPVVDLDTTSGLGSETTFTEDGGLVALAPAAAVSDADGDDIQGATITLDSAPDGSAESLAVDATGTSVTATSYDSGTRTITLSGNRPASEYQTVIRSLKYGNSSQNPSGADRTVDVTVTDTTARTSQVAPALVHVVPVNDAPVITASSGNTAYAENAGAVAVDPALNLTDAENDQIVGATIKFQGSFTSAQDSLGYTDSDGAGTGIDNAGYDAATGVLTLNGTASLADYKAALRSVTYTNSSDAPAPLTRTVRFQVADATASNTTDKGITITPSNDPPTAVNDTATTDEDTSLSVAAPGVLGNDTDPDGVPPDTQTVTQLDGTALSAGTRTETFSGGRVLTLKSDGSYTFNPGSFYQNLTTGQTAHFTFTYQMKDSSNVTSSATADISITGINDAPTAVNDTYNTNGNTALYVSTTKPSTQAGRVITGSVKSNDTDPEGQSLSVTAATGQSTSITGGKVDINTDGSFTYRPPAGSQAVSDSFTYSVSDGSLSSTGTVTIPLAARAWYVDNTSSTNGDGTSTNPFNNLASAQSASATGDTIYVFKGTNGTTGLDTGFTLKDTQRLIGQAQDLKMDPDGAGSLGTETYFSGSSANRPTITKTDANVVDLASGDTVAGLKIDPQGNGGGIAGGSGDAAGTLTDVDIRDTGTFGTKPMFELDGTSGAWNIAGFNADNTAPGSGFPSTETGVRLNNNSGTVNFATTGGAVNTINVKGSLGLDAASTNMGSAAPSPGSSRRTRPWAA